MLERLGTEPKGLGKEQATSRGAPGRLKRVNAAPKRGQGLGNQRVKTRCPAPARGLAAPGGVARGRARVCRSCRWAGPGREREGRGAELAPRRAPRRAGSGLRQRAGPVASVPETPRRTLEQRVSEAGPPRRPSQRQPLPVPSAPRDSSGGTRSRGGGASRCWGPGGRGVKMKPMMSRMLRRAWGAVEAGGGAARIMSPLPLRPAPRGHRRWWGARGRRPGFPPPQRPPGHLLGTAYGQGLCDAAGLWAVGEWRTPPPLRTETRVCACVCEGGGLLSAPTVLKPRASSDPGPMGWTTFTRCRKGRWISPHTSQPRSSGDLCTPKRFTVPPISFLP